MAGKGLIKNKSKTDKIVAVEKKKVEAKRKITGDKKWEPAQGAGMIPEKVWKEKYSPDSKTPSDYKKEK